MLSGPLRSSEILSDPPRSLNFTKAQLGLVQPNEATAPRLSNPANLTKPQGLTPPDSSSEITRPQETHNPPIPISPDASWIQTQTLQGLCQPAHHPSQYHPVSPTVSLTKAQTSQNLHDPNRALPMCSNSKLKCHAAFVTPRPARPTWCPPWTHAWSSDHDSRTLGTRG